MPLKLILARGRSRLAALPNEVTPGAGSDAAIITHDGKPILAIMPSELYDNMLEKLEILGGPDHVALLQTGL